MKLKNLTQEELDDIATTLDNEDFWYCLNDGGYLSPEDVMDNETDIERVLEAIDTLKEFQSILPQL